MIDEYLRILEAAAESDDKKVHEGAVAKLIRHLKGAGRLKMLPEILREFRKVNARRKALAPFVEVASESETKHALKASADEGIAAKHAHVNHALIKGFRARGNGRLVDRSAKRGLTDIYQKITN